MTRPRPRARSLGATLALTALAASTLLAAASASSAAGTTGAGPSKAASAASASGSPSGATTIELKGAVAASLRAQHVRISARKPAQASERRIVLPVTGGSVAASATLRGGGSVSFSVRAGRRTRTARLTAWQTHVGTTTTKVSAKLGDHRVTLFTIAAPKRRTALDRTLRTARLTGGTARLTAAGATALRRALALRHLTPGRLGSAKVAARLGGGGTGGGTGGGSTAPGGGGGTPGGGNMPGPGTSTRPTPPPSCQGFSSDGLAPASEALARTGNARSVTAAAVQWYARDSWVGYLNQGLASGDGVTASEGARDGPRDPPSSPTGLVYSWSFGFTPSAASWYDPSANVGVVSFTGSIRFQYLDHGLDLTLKNPEIELNGGTSRVVFTVVGSACSRVPTMRVDMLKLSQPAATVNGNTFSFAALPATMTAAGSPAFDGFYIEGNDWGRVDALMLTTAP